MKISQLKITQEIRIESKTDAVYLLSSQKHIDRFIANNGDVEIKFDSVSNIYRVPSFAKEITEYIKIKLAHCQQYSSN